MKLRTKILTLSLFAAVFLGRSFAARDNSQFIDDNFWQTNPTSGEIVDAVFGNTEEPQTTAYTKHRENNSCIGTNMSVEYIGENLLPETLAENTIYVVNGAQQISSPIHIQGDCVALLGSNENNIIITHNGDLGYDGALGSQNMIYTTGTQGIIIDELAIKGPNGSTAEGGINIYNGENITIHNVRTDTFINYGIRAEYSRNIKLQNIDILHIAMHGLRIENTENTFINYLTSKENQGLGINSWKNNGFSINNSIIIDNGSNGIDIQYGTSTIIQNSYIANNGDENQEGGIFMRYNNNNTIHNVNLFKNQDYQSIISISNNTKIHNLRYYMKASDGIIFTSNNEQLVNTYGFVEGLGYMMNQSSYIIETNSPLLTGESNLLGRDSGTIKNRPILENIECNLEIHLGSLCGIESPTYGDLLRFQSPTVIYSGNELILDTNQIYTSYDTDKYIADLSFGGYITTPETSNEYYNNGMTYTDSSTIQLVPAINDDVFYHITGDITQIYTGVINAATEIDIERSTGDGIKTITTTFTALEGPYSGQISNEYLLMRFVDTTGPNAPTIISPENGDNYLGYSLSLSWIGDPLNQLLYQVSSTSGISGYNYEISTSDEFNNIVHSESTQDISATVNNLVPNNYYRRVQAVDNLGNAGERASTGPVLYGFSGFNISIPNTTFPTDSGQAITITAYDTDNNVITGYQGTVTVSIDGVDTIADVDYDSITLPDDYTFTLNDDGSHTFDPELNIDQPGMYEITIQDTTYNDRNTSILVTAMGEYLGAFSGTLEVTPAYTTGPVLINFSASEQSDFILQGAIPTQTGTINGQEEQQTNIISTLDDDEVTIHLTLYTGYYQHVLSTTTILDTTAPEVTLISPVNERITASSQIGLSRTNTEAGDESFSGYIIHVEGVDNEYNNQTNTTNNSMTTTLDDGTYNRTVYAYDQAGNISSKTRTFTIDTTAPEIESASPSDEIVAVPFTFNRNVTDEDDLEQATIVVYDNNDNIIAGPAQTTQTSITTSALGINGLPSGVYNRSLTITDNVGNEQTESYTFGVENAIAGQIDGSVNISSLFGTVNVYDNTYYTNTTQLQAHIFANQSVTADINGDINPSQLGLNILMPFPYITQAITLTNTNGNKNINTTLSAPGLADKTILTNIVLDTQDPSTVTLLHPTNGEFINNETLFDRNDATDQISDIGVYKRNIATNQSFSNIIASGETIQSEMIIDADTLTDTGLFYRQVIAYDQAGNMSTSNYSTFQYNGTATNTDTTPNNFTFDEITNATPGQTYTSQTITISGLGANIQTTIEISTGALSIDNILSGLTGTVSNGSQVKIELQASSDYEESVTSTVNVGSISTPFTLTTKQEPISASGLDTLQITANPSTPEEDERIDVRIRARNNDGDILTNYQGTIEFSLEYLDGRVRRTANNADYTLEENEYIFASDDDGDRTIDNLLRLENDQKNYRLVTEDTQAEIEGFSYFCLRNDDCHEEGATTLSRSQRLQIGIIFNSLVNAYEQNPDTAILFFAALEDAVTNLINSSNITSLEDEALRYFRDLTRSFLESLGGVENTGNYDGSIYVAPNGKQYRVSFNIQRQAYTSPDFGSPKYYISLEAFQAHINANNAGPQPGQFINGNNQTDTQNPNSGLLDDLFGGNTDLDTPTGDVIIAPNGKVYRVEINNGQYTSPDFLYPRQFPTYNALRNHIYTHNQ